MTLPKATIACTSNAAGSASECGSIVRTIRPASPLYACGSSSGGIAARLLSVEEARFDLRAGETGKLVTLGRADENDPEQPAELRVLGLTLEPRVDVRERVHCGRPLLPTANVPPEAGERYGF